MANPRSGRGADPRDLARELETLGARVARFSPDEVDAAVAWGPDRLVVAAGDGTIGPAAAAAAHAALPLAVVPTGTGNDFARALGVPLDVGAALRLAVGGRERRVDLAWLGDRAFVNVVNVGLAVAAAHHAKPLKRRLGPLAYAVAAARAALRGRPVRLRVLADGEPFHDGTAWQVLVSNSGAFGGGSAVETADPADAWLEVTVLEAGPRLRLLRYGYALRAGRVTAQPGVRSRRAREVRLELAARTPLAVDGEVVRPGPVTIHVEGRVLAVVVP